MTLEAAQTIVYRELGIWDEGHCNGTMTDELSRFARGNGHCIHGQRKPHEIEMPPLTDGLLAVILRRLPNDQRIATDLYYDWDKKKWCLRIYDHGGEDDPDSILAAAYDANPVIAAVMAFAQYLEVRK